MPVILSILLSLFSITANANPACEVRIVGTVHHKHSVETYPLRKLEILIDKYQPDLIFVEVSKEALDQDDWTKTPPEMRHVTEYARKKKITVAAFDSNQKSKKNADAAEDLKALRQTLHKSVGGFAFDKVNSKEADIALEEYHTKRNLLVSSEDPTRLREKFMDTELEKELTKNKPVRALVFTGFTHRLHLEAAAKKVCKVQSPVLILSQEITHEQRTKSNP